MARNSLKNVIRLLDEAKQSVPPEQGFLTDLKRSIELTDKRNRVKGSQCYKPSSMNCIRQMYYMVSGVEPECEESSYCLIGICNTGTDTHQRIQQAVLDMKSNGIDCEYVNVADYVRSRNLDYLEIRKEPDFSAHEYETKLYHKTLNMSFLCDGIIRYNNHYYILEIKTESGNKFWSRQGVNEAHYNQGTAYSIAFGIDEVIFLYISRDTLDMKTYLFVPTDAMKHELVSKIEICDEHVKQKTVPAKPDDVTKKTCEYCQYRTQCRLDG